MLQFRKYINISYGIFHPLLIVKGKMMDILISIVEIATYTHTFSE
jgi:hypothetical protein